MDPRKLSPAVLLALGLHGCQCAERHVGPCLSIAPVDPPEDPPNPPPTPGQDSAPPEPPVGPCLTPLAPPPTPPAGADLAPKQPDPFKLLIGPCLEPPMEAPEVQHHPCLSLAPPRRESQPVAPPEAPIQPCLSELPYEPPPGEEAKASPPDKREAVLRRVESALPPDVAATLRRTS